MAEWWKLPYTADPRSVEDHEVSRVVIGAADEWLGRNCRVHFDDVAPHPAIRVDVGGSVTAFVQDQPTAARCAVVRASWCSRCLTDSGAPEHGVVAHQV
jgi:hypothetical protein